MGPQGWRYGCLGTITAVDAYWTVQEAAMLFAPLSPREVRARITAAGVCAVGRRPQQGRGRSALVYDAVVLCQLLG